MTKKEHQGKFKIIQSHKQKKDLPQHHHQIHSTTSQREYNNGGYNSGYNNAYDYSGPGSEQYISNNGVNINKPLPQQPSQVTQRQQQLMAESQFNYDNYNQSYNYFQNGTNEESQYYKMDSPIHNISPTTTTTLQQIKTSTVKHHEVISDVNDNKNIDESINTTDKSNSDRGGYSQHPLQFTPNDFEDFVENSDNDKTSHNDFNYPSTANDVKLEYYRKTKLSSPRHKNPQTISQFNKPVGGERNISKAPKTAPFSVQLKETILSDKISPVKSFNTELSDTNNMVIDDDDYENYDKQLDKIPEEVDNDNDGLASMVNTKEINDITKSVSNIPFNSTPENESPTKEKITITTTTTTTAANPTSSIPPTPKSSTPPAPSISHYLTPPPLSPPPLSPPPSQDKQLQQSFSKDSGYQSSNNIDRLSTKNSVNSFENVQIGQGIRTNVYSSYTTTQRQFASQNSPQRNNQTNGESTLFYNTRNQDYKHYSNPITISTTNFNVVNNDMSSHTPPELPVEYFTNNSTHGKFNSDPGISHHTQGLQFPRKESPHPGITLSPMFKNRDEFNTIGSSHSLGRISMGSNFFNNIKESYPFSSAKSVETSSLTSDDNNNSPISPPFVHKKGDRAHSFTNDVRRPFSFPEDRANSLVNKTDRSIPFIGDERFNKNINDNNINYNIEDGRPNQYSPYKNKYDDDSSAKNSKRNRHTSMPPKPHSNKSKRFSIQQVFKKSKRNDATYIQAIKELQAMHYNEAVRLLSQVLITYPNSYSVRCDRAYAAYQTDAWSRATNDLTIAINRKPKKAKAYSLRGEVYRLMNDNDKALADLNKSLKIQKHPFTLKSRAEVYSFLGRFSDALADFDAALEMDPKNSFTLIRRAKVYFTLKLYPDAINDLTKALSLDPSNAHIILPNRGEIYRQIGRLDDSLRDLNQALSIEETSLALERRGAVYRMLGRDDDALADFERIIQLNPRSFLAHKNRAEILNSLGHKDAALVNLNVALQLDRNNLALLRCRGEISHSLGLYQDAIMDFNAALRIQPNDAELLRNRGEIYRNTQEFDKAITDFTRSLEIEPYDVFALTRRGEVYRMLKQGSKALIDLDEAIKLDPENIMARESRGAVNRTFRRYEEALRDLDEAIYLNPESVFALTNRGAVYFMLKRYHESLMDLNKALSLDTKHIFALETRGALLNVLKRYEDAYVDLDLAIELEPTNVWALTYRGEVLASLGRNEDALDDLNKVLLDLPDWGYPLALRGAVYRSTKYYTKALLDLDRALQNIRDKAFNIDYETKALCHRGAVYSTLGRYEESLLDFNRVLLRDPDNIFALTERSATYYSMSKFDDALKDLENILRFEPNNANALELKRKIEENN